MAEKESFWTSLGGILTGLASVVTAVTGLLYFYCLLQTKDKTEPISPPQVTVLPTSPSDLSEQPPPRPASKTKPASQTASASLPSLAMPPASASKPTPAGILVRVTAKPQVKAGDDTKITVTALSPAGKVVLSQARVDLTATAGYFVMTRSPHISGLTDAHGIFQAKWETLENAAPTGSQTVEFRANITLGNQKTSGKTTLTVLSHTTSDLDD